MRQARRTYDYLSRKKKERGSWGKRGLIALGGKVVEIGKFSSDGKG